ncbi:LysR substrate-binding domain-containing protein [Pseudooceanicola marinus]|uniref:LysR substrate-binding domain-containing protein n=1 Tax=Pseudooceanicola marinus TaxID=396013 RepID=UPI001CD36521|nr:LysR substrate-binding domain-containing protein [Pseudooceanicola marinus]MCA1334544.1 substrate-binding domain-containing protein [Pseudooceanicola marinus]
MVRITGSNTVLQRQADAGGLDLAFRANEPGTEASLSDHELRRLPLELYPRHSPIYRSFAPLIASEDDGDEARPRHFCDSQITIEQMLLAGFGVSALILARVQNSLHSGELIRVPTHTPVPSLDITATHLNRARRKYCFQLLDLARQAAETWARDFDDVVSIQLH